MKYNSPEDIPQTVVDSIKSKRTYISMAERRARKLSIPFGQLSDSVWRDIYWQKSKRRANYYNKKKVQVVIADSRRATPTIVVDDVPTTLDEYLEYYANPAPNDIITIKQLISMQDQLVIVGRLINETLSGDDIDTRRYKDLVEIQKQLSLETRQLQDTLGISRKLRERKQSERKLSDHLQQNIKQARELVDSYGVKIICPDCESRGLRIVQGFVINHFPEMGFTLSSRCASCQSEFELIKAPAKWERKVEPLQ